MTSRCLFFGDDFLPLFLLFSLPFPFTSKTWYPEFSPPMVVLLLSSYFYLLKATWRLNVVVLAIDLPITSSCYPIDAFAFGKLSGERTGVCIDESCGQEQEEIPCYV